MRLWQSRTCATFTVTVASNIKFYTVDQAAGAGPAKIVYKYNAAGTFLSSWSDADPLAGSRGLAFVPAGAAVAAQAPVFRVLSPQDDSPAVVYFSRAGA